MTPNRREFLQSAALGAAALVGLGCKTDRGIAGGFVDDDGAFGHQIRDRAPIAPAQRTVRVPIVIVGGGMAGLSAAWQLDRQGVKDFVVLELNNDAGGNSRSGENKVSRYPWAAHYVPVPNKSATLVRELFTELGVLRDGVWDERALCFAPQERLFIRNEWTEGIEGSSGLTAADRAEYKRFADRMTELRATGEFTIPMAMGTSSLRQTGSLDTISMDEWMRRERFTTPQLRWYADYGCRDDYGARAINTSAWAGVHYFAAREAEERGPLTWPDGNGWIARRLLAKLALYVTTGTAVRRIERAGKDWRVRASSSAGGVDYLADAVIFAAPSFLAPYVVEGAVDPGFAYSPWMTANLTLERWPKEKGFAPAWDNVIYDSPALGYVNATHQTLRTHVERTVWTYYWALADETPAASRATLLRRSWSEWRDLILADLAQAHPDIRECVSRIDIMRMGHAMVRPSVGFLSAPGRAGAPSAERLFYANSDLSGLSLFEEAQYRGCTAADRTIVALRH
ncbi:MAG: FAD-dependent oxidoreductase [Gemmatimonadota bacterium]|nr:FAD-dependent oxidoreductase [Gemmatimonadota bacterium]